MSVWLALALAIIVAGGFAILRRLKLLRVALGFWVTFAAAIGVLALAGHTMTARWHLGPVSGFQLWWVLVTSPEVLVFLFFMITDPKTAPRSPGGRLAYAISLGLLAGVLIAPTTTEYAAKVALLGSLALVCLALPLLRLVPWPLSRRVVVGIAAAAVAVSAAAIVVGNAPAVADASRAVPRGTLPPITILPGRGVQTKLDLHTAQLIAHDLLAGEAVREPRPPPDLARTRPGARPADGDGAARGAELRPAPDRGRALGASFGCALGPGRDCARELGAARRPADRCRARGRPRFPPGLVPLRGLERLHGDDGRRGLLARLQRRRLAGPVRSQLVRERRQRAV